MPFVTIATKVKKIVRKGQKGTFDPTTPIQYLQFDTTPTLPGATAGMLYWDETDHTLSLVVNGSILQIGQEFYARALNNTGGTLTNGTAVSIGAASGNRPTIVATDVSNSAHVRAYLGVVTDDIANNAEGFVTIVGNVRDFNTGTGTESDFAYVSTTPGVIDYAAPTTGAVIRVGIVTNAHAVQGSIYIRGAVSEFTVEQKAALDGANNPSATNPLATVAEKAPSVIDGTAGGTVDIDFDLGTAQVISLAAVATTFTFSNFPSGSAGSVTVELKFTAALPTITWPTLINADPDLSSATATTGRGLVEVYKNVSDEFWALAAGVV